MREETVKCNECKGVVDGPVYVLPEMVVRIEHKKEVETIPMVGPGATEKGKPPDFCGANCMTRWIFRRLTGGTKGGDSNGLV